MPWKRVLVVDDDDAIRHLVATVLRREHHYNVDTANGGAEALSKIALTAYDVIVLDLMMPEVSGIDVLNTLALRHPQIKCVVLMSAASALEVARSMTANVFATLRKPFDIVALVTAVDGCVKAARGPAAPPRHVMPVSKAA